MVKTVVVVMGLFLATKEPSGDVVFMAPTSDQEFKVDGIAVTIPAHRVRVTYWDAGVEHALLRDGEKVRFQGTAGQGDAPTVVDPGGGFEMPYNDGSSSTRNDCLGATSNCVTWYSWQRSLARIRFTGGWSLGPWDDGERYDIYKHNGDTTSLHVRDKFLPSVTLAWTTAEIGIIGKDAWRPATIGRTELGALATALGWDMVEFTNLLSKTGADLDEVKVVVVGSGLEASQGSHHLTSQAQRDAHHLMFKSLLTDQSLLLMPQRRPRPCPPGELCQSTVPGADWRCPNRWIF